MKHKIFKNGVSGIEFYNPTNGPIRVDAGGDGHFGAPRGRRQHDGLDFAMAVEKYSNNTPVFMPVSGKITRISYPYQGDFHFQGAEIINPRIEMLMWYFVPIGDYVGSDFELPAGARIGYLQNIAEKYPDCTPHVHLRITKIDPSILFRFPGEG